jgi:hypothetical protein
MQACAHRLQLELENCAHHIFRRSLGALDIERAMALRGLSRFDLMKHLIGDDTSQHESLNDYWREEGGASTVGM